MNFIFRILFLILLCFARQYVLASEPNGTVLTLGEAIETALQNNARLKAARQSLSAARYHLRKSRLDLLPKADLQFSYARLDPATVRRGNVFVDVGRQLVETFNAGDPNDIRPTAYDNNFATTLQVVQPIYNGGANWAAVGLAGAQEDASSYLLEDTRQQVILHVKTRYLQALQANELVALARKSLESSQRHLQSSSKMLEVGLRSRTDVLRWEVQVATDEGNLVDAENNLTVTLAALKHVMGVPFERDISLSPLAFEPEALETGQAEQVNSALQNHPQLQATRAGVDAGHAGVRLAWAAFQPQVNFVYQLGWERNSTLALDSYSFWNAGVSVNLPLFHSFSNVAQLQENKAELRRLEDEQTEAEGLLALQVIQARSRVETALKRYNIAGKAVEQARENLRVLDNTYEAGLAANIDVLDGQVILTQAETGLIRARYDYWIARAELDRATGQNR